MRIHRWLLGALGGLAVAPGCAHQAAVYYEDSYEAAPAAAAETPQGPPVSTYPVPANDPKGNVMVISLGGEQLPAGPSSAPAWFLHLRLAAENAADGVTWTIDPNEQVASFGGNESVAPAFAEGSGGSPLVTLQKGGRGTLDLYYPLPAASDPAQAVLRWQVHRGREIFAQATSFERVSGRETSYVYYRPVYTPYVSLGLGFGWWWPYDDFYWGYRRPFFGYPYYGYGFGYYGYYGYHPRYYAPYYGGRYSRPYYGGPAYRTGGNWRAPAVGAGPAPSMGGAAPRATPSGGRGNWRNPHR
jgi:hypothetical protein